MGMGGSGLLSAFLGCPAGLHGISGISVGSGPAARPEGALWGGWCLYLKAESGEQRVAPKQHSVWKVLSLPSGRRWLMALGWRGQSRECAASRSLDGLTQAVVSLEHPALRLSSCGCSSDMFYVLVLSYSWSCPALLLPE